MNRLTQYLAALLLITLTGSRGDTAAASPREPVKRALIVALSQYDRGGADDWWDLNSDGDAEAISTLLQRRFDFAAEDIRILRAPEETTGEGIVATFEEWLITPTEPGDIVYFHYSGHGTEIPDDNGDEIDGLDESLVPSDYISQKDGSRGIRDDRLGHLLDRLATKRPASVTLTFDCCYSGTATRGGRQAIRGKAWSGKRPATRRGDRSGEADGPGGFLSGSHPTATGYVMLSATSQGEVASETDDGAGGNMGLFTWAFTQAATDAPAGSNYRTLFERVANLMLERNRSQTPQIEGTLDSSLFDGRFAPAPHYLPVTLDPGLGLILEAGALQGMTTGSVMALYPAGTSDFKGKEPLARATVSEADLNYCRLTLEPGFTGAAGDTIFRAARAIEEVHQYGVEGTTVDLSALADWPSLAALRSRIAQLPLAGEMEPGGETWDVRLLGPEAGVIRMEGQDGSLLRELPDGGDAPAAIAAALEGVARWRFINELENSDPYAQVAIELRVVPVDVVTDDEGYVTEVLGDLPLPPDRVGPAIFPAGTHVMLELRNTGYVDAYVTVLDLGSDGRVGPMWPHPGLRVQDNRILADNRWHRIPEPFVFMLEGPPGPELFKAIATAEPADFSPLLEMDTVSAGITHRAATPLGSLLDAATHGRRAGSAVDSGNWAVASQRFIIAPKD